MILLIIKSYLTILLSVGIGSLLIFIIGLYFIFKKPSLRKEKKLTTTPMEISDSLGDLSGIAGDDVIATQLDLARAYIETGKMPFAKAILESVVAQGNAAQQEEARQLMNCR